MTARGAAFALALTAAGCGAAPSDGDPLVQAVRADAARRAGIAVERTRVVENAAVTWRDGGLGCPEPGRLYTQALVPGRRVRIDTGDAVHEYHAGPQASWRWCPPGRAEPPADDPRS